MRTLARKRLPKTIFEFIDGGAQNEISLRANREDFERYGFRKRVLTDISQRDQSTTILGEKSASPLILAPTGLAGILHRRGSDVIKALCLGARACMIGRAWLYGVASGGEAGVARSLDILTKEIDLALALLGRSRLDELHPEILTARA